MGRISSPCLNKAGLSMFWNSMWDDKHNFTKLLNENEFINICVPLIFEDFSSNNLIFHFKKKQFNLVEYEDYNIFLKKTINIKNIFNLLKFENFYSFVSKTWVLRYHGWIIIYIFIYLPAFNSFLTDVENSFENEHLYYNVFFNYYFNLLKINFNNNYFNNQVSCKTSF